MASARKKQDEKNLKILRELVSLPYNKYCFDCNQRGPTYVNVTIGSFVCTKCSGMLRGITPPHRVKSISMATFNQEEVDFIRSRGNDYCKKTYLGLYEGSLPSETRDEQQIRDFMVDKYERKRYYMEPSMVPKNGHAQQQNFINKPEVHEVKPLRINGNVNNNKNNIIINNSNETTKNNVEFVADFASADIFCNTNNNNTNSNTVVQQSFANFDNNPVFNNTTSVPPGSMPNSFSPPPNNNFNGNLNGFKSGPMAPAEDRYAALKDLDNAFKSQTAVDWSSGSNNSLHSSSTPAGSLYSSPSPQSSMYGSPSQTSQFPIIFPQDPTPLSNPFNNTNFWNTNSNGVSSPPLSNGNGLSNNITANPFRAPDPFKVDPFKVNGINQGFQTMAFTQPINGTAWTPNPFKLGTTSNGHSNNPFL